MPIDPDLESVLRQAAGLFKPIHEGSVDEARGMATRSRPPGEAVHQVLELVLDTEQGVRLPARLYRPTSAAPIPALVYFHGGGWVLGDLDIDDGICRALANRGKCAVISVQYRLAPEYPFPAAVDDATDATHWVMDHAGDLGLDPARIAVGGTSAGGNLAAVVARRFRDSGQSSVVAQLLIYPVIDHGFDRPSMRNQKQKYGLTAETMRWFWARYLDAADPGDPDASPIRAEDLSRLPPAIVVTAEFDPLRDEGDEYAEAMVEAGVPVWHMRADGMTHGFCGLATAVPKAAELLDQIGRKLREFIGPRTSVG